MGLIMETHLLRRTARDPRQRRYWPLWLRRHGGAGMDIDDEGEWQLRWIGELGEEGRCFWKEGGGEEDRQ